MIYASIYLVMHTNTLYKSTIHISFSFSISLSLFLYLYLSTYIMSIYLSIYLPFCLVSLFLLTYIYLSGGLRVSWALGSEAFMGPFAAALNTPPRQATEYVYGTNTHINIIMKYTPMTK